MEHGGSRPLNRGLVDAPMQRVVAQVAQFDIAGPGRVDRDLNVVPERFEQSGRVVGDAAPGWRQR